MKPIRLLTVGVASCLLAGCAFLEPRPDLTRFYVLSAVAERTDHPRPDLSIGIGPISLPDYLDRQEIVIRSSATEVQSAPLARWAGALESNVGRTLAENLVRQLGTDRVWSYPSYEITRTQYVVDVTFVRFELDAGGAADLVARWQVRDQGNVRSSSRETVAQEAAAAGEVGAGVEALSRVLATLAGEIASAIVALDATK